MFRAEYITRDCCCVKIRCVVSADTKFGTSECTHWFVDPVFQTAQTNWFSAIPYGSIIIENSTTPVRLQLVSVFHTVDCIKIYSLVRHCMRASSDECNYYNHCLLAVDIIHRSRSCHGIFFIVIIKYDYIGFIVITC